MKVYTVAEVQQRAIEEGGTAAVPAVVGLLASAKPFETSRFDADKKIQKAYLSDGGDNLLSIESKHNRVDLTQLQGQVIVLAKPTKAPTHEPIKVKVSPSGDRTYYNTNVNSFAEVYVVTPDGLELIAGDSDADGSRLTLPSQVPQPRVKATSAIGFTARTQGANALAPQAVSGNVIPFPGVTQNFGAAGRKELTPEELAETDEQNFTRYAELFEKSLEFMRNNFTDEIALQQSAGAMAASVFIEGNRRR